jgi:CheY-like chemotaxis protein
LDYRRSRHDLLRRLAREEKLIPAVAVSGFGDEGAIFQSLEAGFNSRLSKPFAISDLLDRLSQIIA